MWKARGSFALAVLGAAALAVYYEDKNVGFTLLYALGLLFLFSLGTALAAPYLIIPQETVSGDTVFKNESLDYSFSIKNKSLFFYPDVKCVFHNPDIVDYGGNFPAILPPFGGAGKSLCLLFPYRGIYGVGIRYLSATDCLGLFRMRFTPKQALSVCVYPQVDDSFSVSLRNEPQSSSLGVNIYEEDYTSVADVRKYEPSDSLKKIHWKLTAGRGELLVKNFHSFEPCRTILMLDTKIPPVAPALRAAFEDGMVSYAASAVNFCMQGRLPADLVYGGADSGRISLDACEEPHKIYRLLASIVFHDRDSILNTYGTAEIAADFHMVLFVSDIDARLHNMVKDIISMGHNVLLYCFYSAGKPLSEEKDHLLESLKAYGAGVHSIALEVKP